MGLTPTISQDATRNFPPPKDVNRDPYDSGGMGWLAAIVLTSWLGNEFASHGLSPWTWFFLAPLLSFGFVSLIIYFITEYIERPYVRHRYQRWLASPSGQERLVQERRREEENERCRAAEAAQREAEAARRRAELARKAQTQQYWRNLSSQEFESRVGELFQAEGYTVCLTPASNDEGIDAWLEKNGKNAILQCKRFRAGNVSRPDIQQFYGVLMANSQVNEGFFVTTAGFSDRAIEFVKKKKSPFI